MTQRRSKRGTNGSFSENVFKSVFCIISPFPSTSYCKYHCSRHSCLLCFVFEVTSESTWASLVAQTVKNLPAMQGTLGQSLGGEMPWRREWLCTPVFIPGEFHGERSLLSYNPWGRKESDTIAWLTLSFSFWLDLQPRQTVLWHAGCFPSLVFDFISWGQRDLAWTPRTAVCKVLRFNVLREILN